MYYLNTTREREADTIEFSMSNCTTRANEFCDFKDSNHFWTGFC